VIASIHLQHHHRP